jgi:hypothetical protein
MEDMRGTVTDASQSTTFRLCSSAAAPVTGAAARRQPLPQDTRCASIECVLLVEMVLLWMHLIAHGIEKCTVIPAAQLRA